MFIGKVGSAIRQGSHSASVNDCGTNRLPEARANSATRSSRASGPEAPTGVATGTGAGDSAAGGGLNTPSAIGKTGLP